MKSKLLFRDNDWSIDTIHNAWDVIQEIAVKKYDLDFYPPRFELIDFDGMLNAYSTYALPGLYSHWSFGKKYVKEYQKYKETQNLAFEVVINSNPSICYLMDSNTATTQVLVMAHAAVGHSSFFKNNHMFKTHTNADSIIPFLARSSKRIRELETVYSTETVSDILDLIHVLGYYSFDKNKKTVLTKKEREELNKSLNQAKDLYSNKVLDFSVLPAKSSANMYRPLHKTPEREENLLKFIYENTLHPWPCVKELVGIFLEVNQYLYPQMHTQLMNEGWASFWHHQLMKDLYEEGYIDDSSYFEFIQLHCSVLSQPGIEHGNLSINPYKLGFDMYHDIKRIALEPTEEDKEWFPDWAGNGDWLETIKYAMKTFKDESFITQYLSPKLIRQYKFIVVELDHGYQEITVTGDHTGSTCGGVYNNKAYNEIVNKISNQYDFFDKIPPASLERDRKEPHKFVLYFPPSSNTRVLEHKSMEKITNVVRTLMQAPVDFVTRNG